MKGILKPNPPMNFILVVSNWGEKLNINRLTVLLTSLLCFNNAVTAQRWSVSPFVGTSLSLSQSFDGNLYPPKTRSIIRPIYGFSICGFLSKTSPFFIETGLSKFQFANVFRQYGPPLAPSGEGFDRIIHDYFGYKVPVHLGFQLKVNKKMGTAFFIGIAGLFTDWNSIPQVIYKSQTKKIDNKVMKLESESIYVNLRDNGYCIDLGYRVDYKVNKKWGVYVSILSQVGLATILDTKLGYRWYYDYENDSTSNIEGVYLVTSKGDAIGLNIGLKYSL